MEVLLEYQHSFEKFLDAYSFSKTPKGLYDPITYILNLEGKRIRPILTLMATEVFGADANRAFDAALAIEVFHNFSLVHDDIMDAAPLRRGMPTVHKKWDVNTGILSGDAMLIIAYQLFENYPADQFKSLVSLFSKTAKQVCEGQQYDVDFEMQHTVLERDYLKMITLKTAVLVGTALQMGGIIAGASLQEQQIIYDFGKNLGIAFQLQDDYLDLYGDPEKFGKKVGGDVLEKKKTYLYIQSQLSNNELFKKELLTIYSNESVFSDQEKISRAKQLFATTGAAQKTTEAIALYTQKALSCLENLSISNNHKQLLEGFATYLMNRRK